LACLLEASLPKPGNVHRGADFEDLSLYDFQASAVAIGPAMDQAAAVGRLGQTVLRAIESTRAVVRTNTNLGMVLLLAPLACVPREEPLETGLARIYGALTPDDSHAVYRAIRMAQPGGLGKVQQMDLADRPPPDLLAAMASAAERDLIARQYTNRFQDLFSTCVPWLRDGLGGGLGLAETVAHTHVRLMHRFPDSLIARKCGLDVAAAAAARAGKVLDCGGPADESYRAAVADLDFWLRSDGHRRNPGTTADFVAAGLFVLLRNGLLRGPFV
jgi:triphosphoribosyl-dephospho-CoA synthase